jgi:hypothetical protein
VAQRPRVQAVNKLAAAGACAASLLFCTVPFPTTPDTAMNPAAYRYLYRPSRQRVPRWLYRLWAWL